MNCDVCDEDGHEGDNCPQAQAMAERLIEELEGVHRVDSTLLTPERFNFGQGFDRETGKNLALLLFYMGPDEDPQSDTVSLAIPEESMDKLMFGGMATAFRLWQCSYHFTPEGAEPVEGGESDD